MTAMKIQLRSMRTANPNSLKRVTDLPNIAALLAGNGPIPCVELIRSIAGA
jgi:hypothetical protein